MLLRCDVCGQFVGYVAFNRGAVRTLVTPDSDYSREEWETMCIKCARSEPPSGATNHEQNSGKSGNRDETND